jgi:hypothetical protein
MALSCTAYNGPFHSEAKLNWCHGYFVGIPLVCRLRSLASSCFSTDPHCCVPGDVCQGRKDDYDLLHTNNQVLVNPEIWTIELYCACVLVLWCFFFFFSFPSATYSIGAVRFGSEALSCRIVCYSDYQAWIACNLGLTDMLCIECTTS